MLLPICDFSKELNDQQTISTQINYGVIEDRRRKRRRRIQNTDTNI